jgi:NADH-quinone oxidoreductase subunit I
MGNPVAAFFSGILSLVKGLLITLKYMFARPITIQYPEQRAALPLRYRGRLVLPVDPEKGSHRCTACMRCVQACPNHSIDVEKVIDAEGKPRPKASWYRYNLGTCMFCNLCVEACPFFALVMSDEYELASTDKSRLMLDLVAEGYKLAGPKAGWWQAKFRGPSEEG